MSRNFIWLLRVFFSSQQCLNRPAVNAVQWRHSYPKTSSDLIGWLSKDLHTLVIMYNYQDCSQTSDQDEAHFERQRRGPLGGCGGMPPPQKILKSRSSEMLL